MLSLTLPLILASASPRRRQLLRQMGLTFEVEPSGIAETDDDSLTPEVMVRRLATEKAQDVAARHERALVLGSDTTVVLNGHNLGKPADEAEARRMLATLSGQTHTVFTGIALVHRPSDRIVTAVERTDVTFAELRDDEIAAYVRTGSPLDKAGAYGIQDDLGALFIRRIEGDYYNVVGLPVHRLYTMLRDDFADCLQATNGTAFSPKLS